MERKDLLTYAWGVAKLSCSVACLSLRLLEKKETLSTALQRLGWSSIERRNGPVLWFNVGGMGETSTVLPVVYRCLQEYNEKVTVLVTTSCMEVYQVLGKSLPHRVLVQLVPLENPITVAVFLRKWQPQIGVFMETPFQRELALMARKRGVRLALLNAHLPGEDMLVWHAHRTSREVLKQMLSSYSLIVPRTYVDVGRLRMFGATLGQMPGWSTDLQQASELGACATCFLEPRPKIRRSLLRRLGERQLWIAANTLPDEDTVVARIHATLRSRHKALLTVVAPRVAPTSNSSSNSYAEAARRLSSQKRLKVVMLSAAVQDPHRLSTDVDVLVLDDPEVLTSLYSLSEIVLVGGSLMPSPDGASSPAVAAVASCALLMGPHGAEYLGLAVDLNHAAIMASEEVAAAVAQTGVTMRGVNPGGLETPRDATDAPAGRGETSGPWLGWGSRVDVAARTAGYGRLLGPASVEAGCAASESRAHGISRRNRGWFMQSMERTARPLSAPATVPENFHLRVPTPSSALSACGFSSISHEASSGTAGARDVLVAPFSGSGVTYSRGSLGLPTDCTDANTAQGNHDFALSRSALDVVGTDSKQRRAIDRFRWAANREVIGFGYTSAQDARSDSSASSTCDPEEWAKVEVDEGKGACNVKPTSAATNDNSSLSAVCNPVLWSLDEGGDECDAVTVPQDETGPNLIRDPSQTILPESKMPEKATDVVPLIEMAVAAPLSLKELAALETLPLFTACAPDAGLSAQRDGDAASHVDEHDFHDVVETQEVQPAYHGQGTRERAPGPAGGSMPDIESGASTGSVLIGELAVKPDPSNGQELQLLMQPGPGGANQQVAGTCSMYIPPNNASLEEGAGRRVVPQAVDQVTRVQAHKAEVEAAAMADAALDERCAAMATAVKTSPKQQPGDTAQSSPPPHADARDVLQRQQFSVQGDCVDVGVSESPASGHGATHEIHLVMCGDVDSDNNEIEWLPRQRFREARHLTSDPGLASSEFRCCGDERRGFSLDWPAPSAKSLVVAFHSSQGNTESDEDTESTAAIILPGRAHQSGPSAPIPPERPHSRALVCLDDDVMTETWASDVSLAAIIESCKDCSSSHPSQLLSQSHPNSSMTHEASGVWAGVLASPRSSLDCLEATSQHTLVASLPSSDLSRYARGSLASRTLAETSNATNMTDVLHPEVMEVAAGTHVQGLKSVGEEDYGDEGSEVVTSGVGHLQLDGGANASLLPQNVETDVPVVGASNSGLDESVESGEPSPTDYAAAVVFPSADPAELDEPMVESSPKDVSSVNSCSNCASSSGADPPLNLTVGVSAFLLSDLCAEVHGSCATDSPKSDFEFGGSVPDDTGSGSPTLLAPTSAHNGSGANIQTSANTASPESTAASQIQDSVAAATSDTALIRQSSLINSPVANDSWCGPAPQVNATGATLYLSHAAATAVPVPPRIQSQAPSSGSSTAESNSSYNAGTCFGRQAPFPWLGDGGVLTMPSAVAPATTTSVPRSPSGAGSGDSGSTAVTGASPGMYHTLAASFSSSMSGTSISSSSSDLPPFHQVASIGSWLDHFGCMLPQPSHGLQRSQVQHDPMIWFNEHESTVPAAALEGVAPGLRAPMHSPLRPFDDEYSKPGIQPQALACVSTTLFPAAPPPISYPAPLPPPAPLPISPSAPSRVTTTAAAKSAGAGYPSALLRTESLISSEQVTSAFSMSRSQYSIMPHARADAPTAPAPMAPCFISAFASEQYPVEPVASFAGMAGAPTSSSTRDELSALLNSPSSPVSPLRITRAVSPMMNCRPAQRVMDSHGFPAATPNIAGYIPPRSPSAAFPSSSLLSPARLLRQQQAAPTSTAAVDSAAGDQMEAGVCPVPLLVKSINTPRRKVKRMMSMHLECSSPLLPQRSSITVIPGSDAVPDNAAVHIFGGHGLEVDNDAATAGLLHSPSPIAAAAGAVALTSADEDPESPCSSGSSSRPTTPRSHVAENASSPFLSPMERALCAVTRGDDMSFEESFAAVVRATPRRSPARSATGCASAHMSPYSLLYRQSLAGDMGPSLNGYQGQSLYEEEQEELAAGEDGGLWQELEDSDIGMPLSPRAHRQNVLFSPHMPGDDDVHVAAGPILMAAAPSYVQLPISALPSVFAQRMSVTPSPATNRLPYGSGGAVTSGITLACELPGIADPTTAPVTHGATSLLVRPASMGSRIATSIPMSSIADIALADGSVEAPDDITIGHNLPSSSSANLESVPTFSLMHTDDDEKSTGASAARGNLPRPLEAHPGRQPRITLSGGLLILSAACHGSLGSHNLSNLSNLSELSNPHNLNNEEPGGKEPGGKETMKQPSVADRAALAPEEPSRHLSNQGGSKQSGISIREAEIAAANGNTTPRASPYSVVGSTETGIVDSLVSSSLAVLAVDPEDSPPRSSAERTSCPRSACPSAFPVELLPLRSASSSPMPCSLATDASQSTPLQFMGVLSSQTLDGSFQPLQSPLLRSPRVSTSAPAGQGLYSPPTSYMSLRATDPRTSPIKVMTSVKQTAGDTLPRAVEDVQRVLRHPLITGDSVVGHVTTNNSPAACFAPLGPALNHLFPTAALNFSGMVLALNAVSPAIERVSPMTQLLPPTSPRHRSSAHHLQAWGLLDAGIEVANDNADNEGALLGMRASCPAGLAGFTNCSFPPKPKIGQRGGHPTLSPSTRDTGAPSHELHAQRNHQQQMWDRARAESRNTSAAGTPRSARKLFHGYDGSAPEVSPPSPSFTITYSDVCVSPVDAPRFPRAAPPGPTVFTMNVAPMTGSSGGAVPSESVSDEVDKPWSLQQARPLLQVSSGQGTTHHSPVLSSPGTPEGHTSAAGQVGVAVAQPSPKCGQVLWMPVSDGSTVSNASRGDAVSAGSALGRCSTPHRHSSDQLDQVLAHMTVQVASPVSPQPRLPPPAASARGALYGSATGDSPCGAAGAKATATVTTSRTSTSGVEPTGFKDASSSCIVKDALLQQPRRTSGSRKMDMPHVLPPCGGTTASPADVSAGAAPWEFWGLLRGAGPGALCAPDAAVGAQWHRVQHSGDNGTDFPVPHAMLPTLTQLPLLPRLRNLPGLPMIRSSLDSAHTNLHRSSTMKPNESSGAKSVGVDVPRAATAEAVQHQRFRGSAPELSHAFGQLLPQTSATASGSDHTFQSVMSMPLPGVSTVAEQKALASLESQFMAAELEASELPIETRVVTPTALPGAADSYNSSGSGVAVSTRGAVGGQVKFAWAAVPGSQAGQSGTVPDKALGQLAAPPSPRSNAPRAALSLAAAANREVSPLGSAGDFGDAIANKARGPLEALFEAGTGGSSTSRASPITMGAETAMPTAGGQQPSLMRLQSSPTVGTEAGAPSLCNQRPGSSGQRCVEPRPPAITRSGPNHSVQQDGPALVTPTRTGTDERGAAIGSDCSPQESLGAGRRVERELHTAPSARYAGKYLLPAAHLTRDTRVGPAVWIVSDEDELVTALNRLLLDSIERQSRGRAAAQGAAKLASSLVSTVWGVLEDVVIAPALQEYVSRSGGARAMQ